MKAIGLVSVLSALALLVTASLAPTSPLSGYKIVPATWTAADGTTFNGTIQQLNAHLETRDRLASRDGVDGRPSTIDPSITIYDNEYIKWNGPVCGEHKELGHHWPGAKQTDTAFNIAAVASVPSGENHGLVVHHGPKMCAMIACRFGAALFWCNDYEHPIQVIDGGNLAAAAKILADTCKYTDQYGDYTLGQIWSNSHRFNLIIHAQHKCEFWNRFGSLDPGEGSADWGDV